MNETEHPMNSTRGAKYESAMAIRRQVEQVSKWLDSQFRLSNGWRFGWDGLLGIIPGMGDLMTSLLSCYIVIQSVRLGCPPSVIFRMGLNILIDNVLDSIPVIGNLFDFVWKSNRRNVVLLESYLASPQATVRSSRVLISLSLVIVFGLILTGLALSFFALVFLWELLKSLF